MALESRISRLEREWNIADGKIQILPFGVGDRDSICYVTRYDDNNGLGSKLSATSDENTEECRTVALDSMLREDGSYFIKADVESYEYRVLTGAKETIRRCAPKIAICIYHNTIDFYSIPLLLKELNPDYHFAVRHYSSSLAETVLYAYLD